MSNPLKKTMVYLGLADEELVETANWGEATSSTADQIVSDPAFGDDSDDLDIPDFLK